MPAIHLTEDDFKKAIQSSQPVLVDFWAPWCGPCKALGPTIDKLSEEFKDKAVVAKVNVDDVPGLAAEFEVSSIPTVKIFKSGKEIESFTGAFPQSKYQKVLEANL
uniref:Thioredoxin n=1 Tax=uncultured bacterium contig00016 TaxID=1181507 RepID=A0A806JZZ0_9BACT|nr:thioredoxin [uncultured bacterium contig00016]